MSLQYKFFYIPVRESQEAEEEMNRFIRSVNITTMPGLVAGAGWPCDGPGMVSQQKTNKQWR